MRGKIGVLFLIIFLLAIFVAPSVWFINEHMQELKEATKDQVETEEVIDLASLSEVSYTLERGVLTLKPNAKYGKISATTIKDIKKKKKKKNATTKVSSAPWGEETDNIYRVTIEEGYKVFLDPSAVGLFYNCKYCKEMDLRGLDTRFCTDMTSMFEGCASLEKIDIQGWNTDKLAKTDNMFKGCDKLQEIIGAGEKVDTAFKSK